MERFGAFALEINFLCNQSENKDLNKWLDNQEVCMILDIRKRKTRTQRIKIVLLQEYFIDYSFFNP